MNDIVTLITRHGYMLTFAVVLAEAIGLPMPAALALIAAGAAAASHILNGPAVLGLAVLAMLIGDYTLFILGRYTGWALLGLLCRVSMNPETCILRSAESFYKRGKMTLLFSKFVPGLNTMAAPLAGSMRMTPSQFLRLDLAGAVLYAGAYFGAGFVFRDFLASITHGFQAAGRAFEEVLLVAAVAYVGYRVWLYRKHKVYRDVPRVPITELARRLESAEANILIADVRSHGYYDAGTERIRGSVRIEPNDLLDEMQGLPKDKDIFLYCT